MRSPPGEEAVIGTICGGRGAGATGASDSGNSRPSRAADHVNPTRARRNGAINDGGTNPGRIPS